MPKTTFGARRSRNRQQSSAAAIKAPLIPLQERFQPLIPLQIWSTRPTLQHEVSHAKPSPSLQSGAASPSPTTMAAPSLQKRQAVSTSTVTDANVVVIDESGNTIAVTDITSVPTGPMPITLSWTTFTIEPLASITGVLTVAPAAASIASAPSSASNSVSASASSTPNLSTQTTSTASPRTTISTLAEPSQSGNNQLGQPNNTTSTTSTLMSTSSTSSPSTLATLASSALITDASSSSSTSVTSSMFTSDSITTATTLSTTSVPSLTSGTPAATTTGAASPSGTAVNVPVVAGVVGGLAGLAVLLGLLLLLFRCLRKRRSSSSMLRSIDDEGTAPGTSHSNAPMTQNFASAGPAGAGVGAGAGAEAAAAGAAGGVGIGAMIKRMTGGSTATTDTTPSERGFQNLGGRKLESVLTSGGDGFGEPTASGDQPNSFSRGWAERFPYDTPSRHSSMIVGPATPFRRPSSSIVELSASRPDSETYRAMNSPPRSVAADPGWPLTNTSAGRPVRAPEMSGPSSPRQPFRGNPSLDPIGRTRYSQDGSRNSRFTEGL